MMKRIGNLKPSPFVHGGNAITSKRPSPSRSSFSNDATKLFIISIFVFQFLPLLLCSKATFGYSIMMLLPVVLAPVVLMSAAMSLFLFKQALLSIKRSDNMYMIRLNTVCEDLFGISAEEIKFDMEIVCLTGILIVLISLRIRDGIGKNETLF